MEFKKENNPQKCLVPFTFSLQEKNVIKESEC